MRRREKAAVRCESQTAGETKANSSHLTSTNDLAFKLSACRSEGLNAGTLTEETWSECVLRAKKVFLKQSQGDAEQKRWPARRTLARCWVFQYVLCRRLCRLMWLGFLALVALGVFLFLCKPASFYLQRKLHTRVYSTMMALRRIYLALQPLLVILGMDTSDYCLISNPMASNLCNCIQSHEYHEWSANAPIPTYIIEQVQQGEVWVIRGMRNIEEQLSVDEIHKFPESHSGVFPRSCIEIVSGEESLPTLYRDIFNAKQLRTAFKSEQPWGLSWMECPDKENPLSLHSLLPPSPFIPPSLHSSSNTMSLFTISTQWSTYYHYQGNLSSPLISLDVLRGVVRAKVMRSKAWEELCSHEFLHHWQRIPLLRHGDALFLDSRYWDYEARTWSNYSITVTSSLVSHSH